MPQNDGSTKKSLFIQVRNYPHDLLKEHLEHVRTEHKDKTKDDYVFNVVLDEVVAATGVIPSQFDIIKPYLPGGDRQAFDNVFIGSRFVAWAGEGSAYNEGIRSASYRWANLDAQAAAWRGIGRLMEGRPWHGYVNYEGVLDYFQSATVAACWEAFLIQSVRDLHAIKPGAAVLWSPAVWSGALLTTVQVNNLRDTLRQVRLATNSRGINWLDLQDMMGRGRADVTVEDVKSWYLALKNDVALFDSLRVNIEMFTSDYKPIDPKVLADREDWYERNGIPVGASWEMRWWVNNHKEL